MSLIYDGSNADPRRAPALVPRPTFGLFDAIFFIDEPGTSLSTADEVIFGHWDDYADQTINILHKMIDQTEGLVFSDDEYTDLVRTFIQAFPHRPNLSTVLRDNVYDDYDCVNDALTNLRQSELPLPIHHSPDMSSDSRNVLEREVLTPRSSAPVQKVWRTWATRVEEIHRGLAERMSRCKPKHAKQDKGDLDLARLSLSSGQPKAESLISLVHKILDSASEPDEEPENPKTGLEAQMQLVGFRH